MLGLIRSPSPLPIPNLLPKFNSPISPISTNPNHPPINFPSKPQFQRFKVSAKNDNLDYNNSTNGEEEKVKGRDGTPRLNLRWGELLLDRDPDNIAAVGLTGLLTWASVQVLWQLFVVTAAILVAALKYTVVAALLVFILITLL